MTFITWVGANAAYFYATGKLVKTDGNQDPIGTSLLVLGGLVVLNLGFAIYVIFA